MINEYRNNKRHTKGTDPRETLEHDLEALFPLPYDEITMLETYFQAHVEVQLLSEETERLHFALDDAFFQKGDLVMDQRILLQHGKTRETLLYAASLLLLERLPPLIRASLPSQGVQPLGRLLHPVPTQQTLVECQRQQAGQFGVDYFDLDFQAPCLARTILYSLQGPVMLVHEIIPLRATK